MFCIFAVCALVVLVETAYCLSSDFITPSSIVRIRLHAEATFCEWVTTITELAGFRYLF